MKLPIQFLLVIVDIFYVCVDLFRNIVVLVLSPAQEEIHCFNLVAHRHLIVIDAVLGEEIVFEGKK